MTTRLFTELSSDPLRDAFWSTQIYLEIEDGTEPELEAYLRDYPAANGIELEQIWAGDSSLEDLLAALRALSFVEKAEHVKFFWPFG